MGELGVEVLYMEERRVVGRPVREKARCSVLLLFGGRSEELIKGD